MRYSLAVLAAVAAHTSAHGVITAVQGANGVTMPGLSGKYPPHLPRSLSSRPPVADGTPRDCATPKCGSEADTSIIRQRELGSGKASALGRTQGGGPVDAAAAIANFMGTGAGAATAGAATQKRQLLGGLLGGKGKGAGGATSAGTKTPQGTSETGVSKAAGAGAASGLPTTADDGTITMTFHQVNQDGAGPLTAQIDATSGGTDPAAFQDAQVTQNVPGIGIGGLSAATTTDFPVKVCPSPSSYLAVYRDDGLLTPPTGPDAPGHDLLRNCRRRLQRLHRAPAELCSCRPLRRLGCLHAVRCGQEARRRVQPAQEAHGPRHPRQARERVSGASRLTPRRGWLLGNTQETRVEGTIKHFLFPVFLDFLVF